MPSAILLAPIILLAYYLIAWVLVGREPKPAAIVARYNPPEGVSPAGARYVIKQRSDDKSLAAALAHMASRGVIVITPADGKYEIRLVRGGKMPEAHDEQRVLELLFADTDVAIINPAQPGHYSGVVAAIHQPLRRNSTLLNCSCTAFRIALTTAENCPRFAGSITATS